MRSRLRAQCERSTARAPACVPPHGPRCTRAARCPWPARRAARRRSRRHAARCRRRSRSRRPWPPRSASGRTTVAPARPPPRRRSADRGSRPPRAHASRRPGLRPPTPVLRCAARRRRPRELDEHVAIAIDEIDRPRRRGQHGGRRDRLLLVAGAHRDDQRQRIVIDDHRKPAIAPRDMRVEGAAGDLPPRSLEQHDQLRRAPRRQPRRGFEAQPATEPDLRRGAIAHRPGSGPGEREDPAQLTGPVTAAAPRTVQQANGLAVAQVVERRDRAVDLGARICGGDAAQTCHGRDHRGERNTMEEHARLAVYQRPTAARVAVRVAAHPAIRPRRAARDPPCELRGDPDSRSTMRWIVSPHRLRSRDRSRLRPSPDQRLRQRRPRDPAVLIA